MITKSSFLTFSFESEFNYLVEKVQFNEDIRPSSFPKL